jgi:hypothetical protein
MACSNCNTQTCGCASGTYVVSQTCPPACSEVFNAACIVYTGVDITCTDVTSGLVSTVVSRNDYLDTIITNLVSFFCNRLNPDYLPSTVVDSGDAYIVVTSATVGYVTTYTVTLDPATLPSASIVTAGVNVGVTGTGAVLDPYVVNAEGTILATSSSILTLLFNPGSPGPWENTYTIGVDTTALPDTVLNTSFGYININPQPNVPLANDMTYTLEVDQVSVVATDTRLTSTLTAAGGIAPWLRTFDVAVDDTVMGAWIMDSVVNNTNPLTAPGLIAGAGIVLSFDPVLHQIEITSTFTDPDRWDELIDFAGNNIFPSLPTSTLTISADSVTDGISAVLGGIPSAAVFTLVNTDKGSDQLIFGTVAVSGQPNVVAATNTDTLTLVEGANIGITTDAVAQSVTIVNEIDHVYSDVIGDVGGSLQAATTTATLEILGGTGISTAGVAGPTNSITITNDSPNVDQNLWETFTADSGGPAVASSTTDTFDFNGSHGISTAIAGDVLSINNLGALQTTVAVTIAGGAVTVPAAGAVNVGPAGILSTFMNVQLYNAAGALLPFDGVTHTITGMGVAAGQFTLTNATLANANYTLVITGNLA